MLLYVGQFRQEVQDEIQKEVEQSIREMELYTEEEIQEHVQRAMDSKLYDLEDTIDISKYKQYMKE